MNYPPRLTGPYDTGRLEAITSDPITITVAWEPLEGAEKPFREALDEMERAAQRAEGSLGVALLEPGVAGGEYHLVARFIDGVSLRRWEESGERARVYQNLAPWVSDVSVAATHSPDAFFGALAGTSAKPAPHRWTTDLLWFLPASLVVSLLLSPYTKRLFVVDRVVIGSAAVSLTYALVLGPVRKTVKRRRNRRAPLR